MDKAKLNSKIFFIFAQISVVLHRNQHNYDKMKLEIQKILLAFALPLLLLFILYTLRTMESVMNWDFITWGIYPKETKGIMGILTSPLIHADWGHLFANTFPLLFLLWCLLYFYRDLGIGILFFIWIVSGILTFIIGKPGWHIRCQQYNLFTRLFSVLQWHSPQTRPFSSPVVACHFSIWQSGMEHVPAVRLLHHFLGGTLGGRSGGIAAAILFRHKRSSTTGTFSLTRKKKITGVIRKTKKSLQIRTKKRKND